MKNERGSKDRRGRFDAPVYRALRRLGLLEPLLRTYRRLSDYRRRRRALAGRGLVPEGPLTAFYTDALARLRATDPDGPLGDYLEFGVCYGSSLACMHDALVAAGETEVRLFGFDSFEGLPEEARYEHGGTWTPGQLHSPLGFTRRLLTRRGVDWSRTHLVEGWFDATLTPETIARHGIERAAIIMVDCVIYSSTVMALAFCAPLVKDRAIIVFDDWNAYGLADRNQGERRAFEEFLARNPDLSADPLPSYSRSSAAFLLARRTAARELSSPRP